jgi:hypothetical protein
MSSPVPGMTVPPARRPWRGRTSAGVPGDLGAAGDAAAGDGGCTSVGRSSAAAGGRRALGSARRGGALAAGPRRAAAGPARRVAHRFGPVVAGPLARAARGRRDRGATGTSVDRRGSASGGRDRPLAGVRGAVRRRGSASGGWQGPFGGVARVGTGRVGGGRGGPLAGVGGVGGGAVRRRAGGSGRSPVFVGAVGGRRVNRAPRWVAASGPLAGLRGRRRPPSRGCLRLRVVRGRGAARAVACSRPGGRRSGGSARRRCRSADRRPQAQACGRPDGSAAGVPAPPPVRRRARARPGGRAVRRQAGAACSRCRCCGVGRVACRTSLGECGRGPQASPPTSLPSRGRAGGTVTGRSHR